ncbi:uncharacterized protein [Anabrus simplex]|uniref:uncharacterized protein n=1 Tax=Anabrus simplex TaxID=316456 RepID=UPI0034DD36B7
MVVTTTTTTEVLTQNIKREAAMIITWRCPPSAPPKEKTLAGRDRREYFMRSASLDRLRRFPAYVCTRGSQTFPNVLLFLSAALTAVQSSLKNVVQLSKKYSLAGTVLASLTVLLLKLVFCISVLMVDAKPLGLIFMVASLLLMALIAYRTVVNEDSVIRKCKKC